LALLTISSSVIIMKKSARQRPFMLV
jgi:hypothetical protein